VKHVLAYIVSWHIFKLSAQPDHTVLYGNYLFIYFIFIKLFHKNNVKFCRAVTAHTVKLYYKYNVPDGNNFRELLLLPALLLAGAKEITPLKK
jgi:hypothetical protein